VKTVVKTVLETVVKTVLKTVVKTVLETVLKTVVSFSKGEYSLISLLMIASISSEIQTPLPMPGYKWKGYYN
jgi:hypothetical protein